MTIYYQQLLLDSITINKRTIATLEDLGGKWSLVSCFRITKYCHQIKVILKNKVLFYWLPSKLDHILGQKNSPLYLRHVWIQA